MLQIVRTGRWNTEVSGQSIGISLVPGPLNRLPVRGWHSKHLREFFAVARQSGDQFFAGGIENPTIKTKPSAHFEQAVYGAPLVPQVGKLHKFLAVARVPRNRKLIIDYADRHTLAAEAAHDSKSLVVAADHDRSRGLVCGVHGARPFNSGC